jgi:hypothetical protein
MRRRTFLKALAGLPLLAAAGVDNLSTINPKQNMTSQEITATLKQVRVGSVVQVTHRYVKSVIHFEERVRRKVLREDYTPTEIWFSGDSRISHRTFGDDFWFCEREDYLVLGVRILEP